MVLTTFFTTSYATRTDDFHFVADLRFGMTVSETEKLLKKNHIEYTLYDLNENPDGADAAKTRSYSIDARWMFYIEDFRIAGYTTDGYLYYNINDGLSDVEYLFYYEKGASDRDKTFKAIESSLERQYGETEYSSETGKKLNIRVSHEPIRYTARGAYAETIHDFDVIEYTERLVETDGDYNVVIQHHIHEKW